MQNNNQMVVQLTVVELEELISNAVILALQKYDDSMLTKKKTESESDEVLTREQVSQLLKVSFPTLWSWNKNGILKNHKIGTKVFYKKENVMRKLGENLH